VGRFIPERRPTDGSSRSVISHIRRQLATFAVSRQREDLARFFTGTACKGAAAVRAVAQAVETLRSTAKPQPLIGGDVGRWLPSRATAVRRKAGSRTVAKLMLRGRPPRRRRWWSGIAGLDSTMAWQIEGFFAAHPDLTKWSRTLVAMPIQGDMRPWESTIAPSEVEGTHGAVCGPCARSKPAMTKRLCSRGCRCINQGESANHRPIVSF
jgi:hypothetical protein